MVTKEYKGYILTGAAEFPSMKRIVHDGKGSVPNDLKGLYTSFRNAMEAIDNYRPKPKGKANASKKHEASGDEQVHKGADNGGESSKLPA